MLWIISLCYYTCSYRCHLYEQLSSSIRVTFQMTFILFGLLIKVYVFVIESMQKQQLEKKVCY
jgi:hypothetical protein